MSAKNNGGPAFPFQANDASNVKMQTNGMTLRDYFAIHADVSKFEFGRLEDAARLLGMSVPDQIDMAALMEFGLKAQAKLRYMVADAMIAARGDA